MLKNAFIDWITASQYHPQGGLPIISGGVIAGFDAQGTPRFERNQSKPHIGSFETSLRVASDGYRVSISGNVGRFSRQDNLFGYGFEETMERANRILLYYGLPAFTAQTNKLLDNEKGSGCYISRLDFTVNYETGSESNARSVVRWLSSRAVSRVKRGNVGDSSYWFANTRRMFKAYIKHLEMAAHGTPKEDSVYQYALQRGILRLELEIKKRLLSEMNMNRIENITDEKLIQLFEEETAFCRKIDRSTDLDIIENIPQRSKIYAQAWLSGNDLIDTVPKTTLYRHAKILSEYGLDILHPRNIQKLEPKVRFIDLVPCFVPDWYVELHKDAA